MCIFVKSILWFLALNGAHAVFAGLRLRPRSSGDAVAPSAPPAPGLEGRAGLGLGAEAAAVNARVATDGSSQAAATQEALDSRPAAQGMLEAVGPVVAAASTTGPATEVGLQAGGTVEKVSTAASLGPRGIREVFPNPIVQWFMSSLIWAFAVVLVAVVYYKEKLHPPKDTLGSHSALEVEPGRWRFGLLSCFDEPTICLLACCCAPIRWADTMRMARILSFWGALTIFVGLVVLDTVCAGLAGVVLVLLLAYYRQRIRRLFGLQSGTCMSWSEDCLAYVLCCCCAVTQEARQLEDAWQSRHPALCPPRQ